MSILWFTVIINMGEESYALGQNMYNCTRRTFGWKVGFALCFVRPVHKQMSKPTETSSDFIYNKTYQHNYQQYYCLHCRHTYIQVFFSGALAMTLQFFCLSFSKESKTEL